MKFSVDDLSEMERRSLTVRFMFRVRKSKKKGWMNVKKRFTPCLLWIGYQKKPSGYGMIQVRGVLRKTHRVMYELIIARIPDGLHVLHRCDNPQCVNPKHLFLGTQQDNVDDMMNKGRKNPAKGEANGLAKLNRKKVRRMRRLRKQGYLLRELAGMFGVTESSVSGIVLKKTWRDE